MDNFTVAIYCFIDDYLKKCHPKNETHRKMCDAQIITTSIIAARYFGGNYIKAKSYLIFSHSGVDARGTARAIVFMGKKGGASTITQQLAKLFFTQRSSSFSQKWIY